LCKDEEPVRYVISRPLSARAKRALRSERLTASLGMMVVGTLIAVVRSVRKMAEVGRYIM
jgi:hypothetical protein